MVVVVCLFVLLLLFVCLFVCLFLGGLLLFCFSIMGQIHSLISYAQVNRVTYGFILHVLYSQ